MYNLEPKTRKEHLMGKIAGNPNAEEITDLKTREEHFLRDIEEAMGGGSAPFVVVLTPTAADMSGTMDKTVGEIYEAYLRGRQIRFRVSAGAGGMEADCTVRGFGSQTYPSFNAYIVNETQNMLIYAFTGTTNDTDEASYATELYTLTPAT